MSKKKKTPREVKQYDLWVAENPGIRAEIGSVIQDALDDAGITYDQVVVRIKDRDSFMTKIDNPNYPDYVDIHSAYDILGARVITYHSSEIPQLLAVMESLFQVEAVVDKAAETARRGRFGYSSQHVIVRVPQLGGMLMEIQLRTVLQHAWAEFEHDIRYKNLSGTANPEIHRAFTLAAGLIELADQQFDLIAETAEKATNLASHFSGEIKEVTLARFLTLVFGEEFPASRVAYYGYAVDMLAAHEITTYEQLAELLTPENLEKLFKAYNYPYPPGQVRLLDDMLLFVYGREHIRKTVHIGDDSSSRPGRLGNRWQKLGQTTMADLENTKAPQREIHTDEKKPTSARGKKKPNKK